VAESATYVITYLFRNVVSKLVDSSYRSVQPLLRLGAPTRRRQPPVGAFLEHLSTTRRNSAATRNARLAAVHSLFRDAAFRAPDHAASIQRVLAIQPQRRDRAVVTFLTAQEIDALLAAPDRTTRLGRRDHALLTLATQTGLSATTKATGRSFRSRAARCPVRDLRLQSNYGRHLGRGVSGTAERRVDKIDRVRR
jgi:integrase